MTALRTLLAVMAVVFMGSAGLFVLLGLRRLREQRRLRGWQRVDGVITHAELVGRDDGAARLSLRYRFTLGGAEHVGDGLEEAISSFIPGQRAEALRRRFAVGTAVQVRVDPQDVSRSVLESKMAPRGELLAVAAVAFVVLAAAFGVAVARLG